MPAAFAGVNLLRNDWPSISSVTSTIGSDLGDTPSNDTAPVR